MGITEQYLVEIHCSSDKSEQAKTTSHEDEHTDDTPTEDHDQDESTLYNDQSVTEERNSRRVEGSKQWSAKLMDEPN